MKKLLLVAVVSGAASIGLLTGCVDGGFYVAGPSVVVSAPPGQVVVSAPPPAPPREVVIPAPGPGYAWVPGYWSWQGRWVWVGGSWVARPHSHAVWVPGYWGHHGHGYMWRGGHWR